MVVLIAASAASARGGKRRNVLTMELQAWRVWPRWRRRAGVTRHKRLVDARERMCFQVGGQPATNWRDHRACSANASATPSASEDVFACAMFDVTATTMPLSRPVISDITIPPASSPLTLPGFVASAKRTRSDGVAEEREGREVLSLLADRFRAPFFRRISPGIGQPERRGRGGDRGRRRAD